MDNMLCDKCQKNPATVHIVKVINGDKTEMNLCHACAQEIQEIAFRGASISPFSFQNLISGFVDHMGKIADQESKPKLCCSNCGVTSEEFKRTGLVGCEQCYKTFTSIISPIIQRVQGKTEHKGKFPKKAGRELINKKRVTKLKEELQKAILEEEYEKAAIITDEIKNLQNNKE